MFEPKRTAQATLSNYIGARVTDAEEKWLRAEMKRCKISMSDLIRISLADRHDPYDDKSPHLDAARTEFIQRWADTLKVRPGIVEELLVEYRALPTKAQRRRSLPSHRGLPDDH